MWAKRERHMGWGCFGLVCALVLLWGFAHISDELKRNGGKPGGYCLLAGIVVVGSLVAAISSGMVSYWTVFAFGGPIVGGLVALVLLMALLHKALPEEKPTAPVPTPAEQLPPATPAPHAPQPVIPFVQWRPKPGEKERKVREFVRLLGADEEAVVLARAYSTDKMSAFVLRDKLLELGCPENLIEETIRLFQKTVDG